MKLRRRAAYTRFVRHVSDVTRRQWSRSVYGLQLQSNETDTCPWNSSNSIHSSMTYPPRNVHRFRYAENDIISEKEGDIFHLRLQFNRTHHLGLYSSTQMIRAHYRRQGPVVTRSQQTSWTAANARQCQSLMKPDWSWTPISLIQTWQLSAWCINLRGVEVSGACNRLEDSFCWFPAEKMRMMRRQVPTETCFDHVLMEWWLCLQGDLITSCYAAVNHYYIFTIITQKRCFVWFCQQNSRFEIVVSTNY
jgi:hypothetical protein